MPKNKANHSETRRDDWETPKWLFDKLNEVFDFKVDLAASESSSKCSVYCDDFFSMTQEDFAEVNRGYNWCWCNPPYAPHLLNWCQDLPTKVNHAVLLIPASTGNQWWHRFVWPKATYVCFIKGRLIFEGAPQVAQFDSALVIFGKLFYAAQLKTLKEIGVVVQTVQ